jgi:hypothetical protein
MNRLVVGALAVLLVAHGLIHLMGTAVYLKLGRIEGLPYKTTLLGGRWDLGEEGMLAFGALWVLPAVGFVLAGAALWAGWPAWRPMLVAVAAFSLVLTLLDWASAHAGAVINIVILGAVLLGSRVLPQVAP